jgi:hypothetical protein
MMHTSWKTSASERPPGGELDRAVELDLVALLAPSARASGVPLQCADGEVGASNVLPYLKTGLPTLNPE